jgi:hypothetical protein
MHFMSLPHPQEPRAKSKLGKAFTFSQIRLNLIIILQCLELRRQNRVLFSCSGALLHHVPGVGLDLSMTPSVSNLFLMTGYLALAPASCTSFSATDDTQRRALKQAQTC